MAPFALRAYQQRIVDEVALKNSIVLLPTGAGKTAVASEVIRRKLAAIGVGAAAGRVVFFVPTCLLVEQQTKALKDWLGPTVEIAMFGGGRNLPARDFRVLVTTPDAYRKRQASGDASVLGWDRFSLVVFDEVHGALKESPYRKIALSAGRHSVRECGGVLQILGLTASLSYSVTEKGVQKAIKNLTRELRIEHMARATEEEMARSGYTAMRGETEVNDHKAARALASSDEAVSLNGGGGEDGVPMDKRLPHLMLRSFLDRYKSGESTPVARGLVRVIETVQQACKELDPMGYKEVFPGKRMQLAAWGEAAYDHGKRAFENMKFGLRRGEVVRLYEVLEHLCEAVRLLVVGWEEDAAAGLALRYLEMAFINEATLPTHPHDVRSVFMEEVVGNVPHRAELKFTMLRKTLLEKQKERGGDLRAVVFVEQRLAAHIVAHFVNTDPDLAGSAFAATHVYAVGTPATPRLRLSRTDERENIDMFRQGTKNVLVATAAAQEGMDVPAANLTVSFDVAHTPVAHIQRRGRARQADSMNVVLSQRADRPVTLLEDMVRLQGKAVETFVPKSITESDAEARAKQANRERLVVQLLKTECSPGDAPARMNEVVTKTKAEMHEKYIKSGTAFMCKLHYISCTRSTEVTGGVMAGKKEAKRVACQALLAKLAKELQTALPAAA